MNYCGINVFRSFSYIQFLHRTGTLWCLQKEMATYRHWSGETQTMFHIVESCLLTKLNGGLSRLHSTNEDAVLWLTSYGSWHTYEKKKKLYFRCCSNEWLVRNDYHINTHYADHSEIVSSSFVMCPDGFRSQIGCLDGNWACVSWTIIGQPGNSIFVCRV